MTVTRSEKRRNLLMMLVATIALVTIGWLIREDLATSIPVAGTVLAAAVVIVAFVPASGVAAVLLALPTVYQLHPLPRGEFSLVELAILAAAAGTGLNVLARIRRGGWSDIAVLFRPAHVVVPVVGIVIATAVTLVTLADPSMRTESLREIRTVIIEPLVFLGTARIVFRQPGAREWAASAFVVAGVVVAGYGVAQVALDLGGVQAGSVTRATGPYPHPNNLSFFIERTLLFTLGIAFLRPKWWPVWILGLLQLAGLGATFSRGALLGLAAGIAIIFILRGLYRWLIALGVLGALGGAAAFVVAPDRLVDMGGSGSEPTRFAIWRSSVRMVLDHPIFGVGPDQFLYQYWRRYVEPMGWPERYTSHPHNLILDAWLRLGVIGLGSMVALVAGVGMWIAKHLRAVRIDPIAMGAVAALAGGLVHGMVDNGFFLPDLATMTWFLVAALVAVPVPFHHEDPESATSRPTRLDLRIPEPVGSPLVLLLLGIMLALVAASPAVPATIGLIVTGAVLAWVSPAVMVALVVATVPIQESVLLPNIRGDLTFTQIVLAGLVIGWGLSFWRYRIWLDAITLWFVAIGGALLISLIAMDDQGLWAGEVYRWAIAGIFFVICRSVLREWSLIAPVLWSVIIASVMTWGYAAWQFVTSAGPEHMIRGGALRVFATFGTPNTLGAYVELSVPLLLILGLLGIRKSFRDLIGPRLWVGTWVSSLPGLLVLAQTQSRGAMVGFAAAMVVVLWVLPVRLRVATVVAGALLVGVVALTPAGQSQIDRFARIFDETAVRPASTYDYGTGRSALWGAAVNMILDNPLTGVGAGEFDHHYREYTPSWVDRFPRGQAHNGWLHMGAQAGIGGLVAFTGWVIASLVSLFNAGRRAHDPLSRALAIGGLAVMIAFSVHSLVDYLNVLSLGLQLSAMVAIGLNLAPNPLTVYAGKRPDVHAGENALQAGVA